MTSLEKLGTDDGNKIHRLHPTQTTADVYVRYFLLPLHLTVTSDLRRVPPQIHLQTQSLSPHHQQRQATEPKMQSDPSASSRCFYCK